MIEEKLSQLVQDVIDGNEDVLKAYAILKRHEDHIKKCLAEISEYALDEAQKHDGAKFTHAGFKFSVNPSRPIYNFKSIEQWNQMNKQIKDFEALSKQAYSAYQKGSVMITEDGEEVPLPEVKYTSPSLSVKYDPT